MIPFAENYLDELIRTKLNELKDNPRELSKILDINETLILKLSEYLKHNDIKIVMGYPRPGAELPCICILLSNEDETQIGLGDFGIDDYDVPTVSTQTFTVIDNMIKIDKAPILNIISATYGGAHIEHYLEVVNPNTGEIYVNYPGIETVTLEYEHVDYIQESLSTLYDINYRIEVWSENGNLTVELYHLIKGILLIGRNFLQEKGLCRQKLGGSDFQPAPSFFPDFVYRRAISFWAQCEVSVPQSTDNYIQSIEVNEL